MTFTYPATEGHDGFTLGPLDLTIRRGDVVFLTGANGSGKSTFGRLLAGLYRPAAGRICADGVPITDARLGAWRALFATVFVEHRTLATLYGVEEQALERAPALLGELELADKTAIVDGRVTNLGLSTGQSKRLALVLTRLQGKPILVLDEWAAEQDPEHRAWFYDELLPALRAEGRTVIVITHDDQYFDRADWRLVMTAGRIASGDR
ncbi:MAG: ATP-binding cassette domain-containing protein [Myxococcales bacterium]|nr:ATP-binding cassette domain-containing protein [Myxococcales bacterium]